MLATKVTCTEKVRANAQKEEEVENDEFSSSMSIYIFCLNLKYAWQLSPTLARRLELMLRRCWLQEWATTSATTSNYLYSSIVYKILFILEEIIYLGELLSTLEVGDYELLSNMVEMVVVE